MTGEISVSRPRVLILDDDPQVGKLFQLIAESVGAEARAMTHTQEFFRAVADWDPTHVAIDLVMPEMDGVEVLVHLAAMHCGAKIIITSGLGTRVLDAAGRSADEHGLAIAGVLSKPFSAKALRALLLDDPAQGKQPSASAPQPRGESPDQIEVSVADIKRAIEKKEFVLAYQPQIRCETGDVAGFEALVRWEHPTRGTIRPDRFIPCVEENGLIDALTDQVLEMAVRWFAPRFGQSDLTISVNLSSRGTAGGTRGGTARAKGEARNGGGLSLVDLIMRHCRKSGLRPASLILELTETSAMEDPVASLDLLTRLRMKDLQLSIDDFGTGYSSMLQLVRLPFCEIKVDKSFVISAIRSSESRAVVESIIGLGHNLGLRVVAEGVEDAATLRYLCDAGCDLAQGYFIAEPMYGTAAAAWIEHDSTEFQTGVARRQLELPVDGIELPPDKPRGFGTRRRQARGS